MGNDRPPMTKTTATAKHAGMYVDTQRSRIIPPSSLDGSNAYIEAQAPSEKSDAAAQRVNAAGNVVYSTLMLLEILDIFGAF
jgi:hypothetical protein